LVDHAVVGRVVLCPDHRESSVSTAPENLRT
jgi:hypothetical protein